MPDKNGRLSQEEKEQIAARLNLISNGSSPTCPMCGNDDWLIGDEILAPLKFGEKPFGGPSYPFVPLLCRVCANTQFFNAVLLGLLPQFQEDNTAKRGGGDG